MKRLRNFAIIAHVDHGKSTLADRLMEITGTVEAGSHDEQMLDRNPISRERGITIKLAPVRMAYTHPTTKESIMLNLIDTPGHVDFSYEVDRTLTCVEGVVLLVDATKGIQAQTIANAYKALEKDLVIIPAVNKIDLPSANVEATVSDLASFLGIDPSAVHRISAKSGIGVESLLQRVVDEIPSPSNKSGNDSQALIFDSYYDTHRGVIAFVRVFHGSYAKGQKLRLCANGATFETTEVGMFTPDLIPQTELTEGEIGYIMTNLKDIHQVRVGDTITPANIHIEPFTGYRKVHPMVYASLFPTDPHDYLHVKKGLEKLYLNDSALEFNGIFSQALGAGFRVGFLGLLHADVVVERLEREFGLHLVLTPPHVDYLFNGTMYEEPIVRLLIVTPTDYVGAVMQLCEDYRGTFITMDNLHQVSLTYEMPMAEMITDFFDRLKSATSGYASLDWELVRHDAVHADNLIISINQDDVPEFSEIVVKERAEFRARKLTIQLKDIIPRQQFEVRIQARFGGRIVASERISPFRKDVTAKLYGGDRTRKDKLLDKQKEGKKKMKMIGKVEIPKEAFLKLFKKG